MSSTSSNPATLNIGSFLRIRRHIIILHFFLLSLLSLSLLLSVCSPTHRHIVHRQLTIPGQFLLNSGRLLLQSVIVPMQPLICCLPHHLQNVISLDSGRNVLVRLTLAGKPGEAHTDFCLAMPLIAIAVMRGTRAHVHIRNCCHVLSHLRNLKEYSGIPVMPVRHTTMRSDPSQGYVRRYTSFVQAVPPNTPSQERGQWAHQWVPCPQQPAAGSAPMHGPQGGRQHFPPVIATMSQLAAT